MANDSLGSIITQGNFLRIDNAFVDEVSSSGRNTGLGSVEKRSNHCSAAAVECQ